MILAGALLRCGDVRLASRLDFAGVGAALLGPAVTGLQLCVGRSSTVATFPDGYAFGSTVAHGAVLLVLRSTVRDTSTIIAGTLTIAAILLAASGGGRSAFFLAVVIVGELAIYLGAGALRGTSRPRSAYTGPPPSWW